MIRAKPTRWPVVEWSREMQYEFSTAVCSQSRLMSTLHHSAFISVNNSSIVFSTSSRESEMWYGRDSWGVTITAECVDMVAILAQDETVWIDPILVKYLVWSFWLPKHGDDAGYHGCFGTADFPSPCSVPCFTTNLCTAKDAVSCTDNELSDC